MGLHYPGKLNTMLFEEDQTENRQVSKNKKSEQENDERYRPRAVMDGCFNVETYGSRQKEHAKKQRHGQCKFDESADRLDTAPFVHPQGFQKNCVHK